MNLDTCVVVAFTGRSRWVGLLATCRLGHPFRPRETMNGLDSFYPASGGFLDLMSKELAFPQGDADAQLPKRSEDE